MKRVYLSVFLLCLFFAGGGIFWLLGRHQGLTHRPWLSAIPHNTIPAELGQVVLVTNGKEYGAFSIIEQNMYDRVKYSACYREDGQSILVEGDLVTEVNGQGKGVIDFGPFRVGWSYATEFSGWVYLKSGTDICATQLKTWCNVDASETIWRYRKYFADALEIPGTTTFSRESSDSGIMALVLLAEMDAGEQISIDNLAKREISVEHLSGEGIAIQDAVKIVGAKLKFQKDRGIPLLWSDVETVNGAIGQPGSGGIGGIGVTH